MARFLLPVSWTMTATMAVEADDLAMATDIAMNAELPTDSFYLDDSFEIDVEHPDYGQIEAV